MTDIAAILKSIDTLKPLPQVTHKVMAIAENEKSSAADLAECIAYDPALTAGILKVCNSAFFALTRRIDSIHQAVAYLGVNQVADMVLLNLGSANLKQAQEGYDLREGELWKYSVLSAFIARDIAERKGVGDKHLVFTAALLKDIGKVVLNSHVGSYFDEIEGLIRERNITFRQAEDLIIGIDHAEIGARTAEKWNFSKRMVEIIRNHHLNGDWREDDLELATVYVADTLCMMMGLGVGCDGLAYRFHPKVMEKLQFSDKDLQIIMADFAEKIRELDDLLK
jgi:putative nucleotidyltransferase with HDIG domain